MSKSLSEIPLIDLEYELKKTEMYMERIMDKYVYPNLDKNIEKFDGMSTLDLVNLLCPFSSEKENFKEFTARYEALSREFRRRRKEIWDAC